MPLINPPGVVQDAWKKQKQNPGKVKCQILNMHPTERDPAELKKEKKNQQNGAKQTGTVLDCASIGAAVDSSGEVPLRRH